jgi:hypothetical protein
LYETPRIKVEGDSERFWITFIRKGVRHSGGSSWGHITRALPDELPDMEALALYHFLVDLHSQHFQ